MTFDAWKEKVDNTISAYTEGLSTDDFPDRNYHDEWAANADPEEVARHVLLEEGWGELILDA